MYFFLKIECHFYIYFIQKSFLTYHPLQIKTVYIHSIKYKYNVKTSVKSANAYLNTPRPKGVHDTTIDARRPHPRPHIVSTAMRPSRCNRGACTPSGLKRSVYIQRLC